MRTELKDRRITTNVENRIKRQLHYSQILRLSFIIVDIEYILQLTNKNFVYIDHAPRKETRMEMT